MKQLVSTITNEQKWCMSIWARHSSKAFMWLFIVLHPVYTGHNTITDVPSVDMLLSSDAPALGWRRGLWGSRWIQWMQVEVRVRKVQNAKGALEFISRRKCTCLNTLIVNFTVYLSSGSQPGCQGPLRDLRKLQWGFKGLFNKLLLIH